MTVTASLVQDFFCWYKKVVRRHTVTSCKVAGTRGVVNTGLHKNKNIFFKQQSGPREDAEACGVECGAKIAWGRAHNFAEVDVAGTMACA